MTVAGKPKEENFSQWGALPPGPRDLPLFSRQNGSLYGFVPGRHRLPPRAFPAAETVARVASQHGPIPSASGKFSIIQTVAAIHPIAANGKLSNSQLSQKSIHPTLACRVHTPVNAVNVVLPTLASCSQECEHGTHECVRRAGFHVA